MQSYGIAMRGKATASPSIAMPGNSVALRGRATAKNCISRHCIATAERGIAEPGIATALPGFARRRQSPAGHSKTMAWLGIELQQHSKGRT